MKTMKKVLALVLAMMLVLGLGTMASAAGETPLTNGLAGDNTTALTGVTFTVDYQVADGVVNPITTFSYTLTPGEALPAVPADGQTAAKPAISAGIADGAALASANVVFTPAGDHAQKLPVITFDATKFTQPGIYRYVLTQTALTSDQTTVGISKVDTYDSLYLDVYVTTLNGALAVTAATLHSDIAAQNDSSAKVTGFTNAYATEPGSNPDDPPAAGSYDVTISKAVDGTMADATQPFDFTISLAAMAQNSGVDFTGVTVKVTIGTGDPTNVALSTSAPVEITGQITAGQSIKIEGLPDSIAITATEDALDYTPAWTITDMTATAASGTTNTATGSVDGGDGTIAFTNTRDAISPTGVVLRFAPYICMLGAAPVVFLVGKKRKEEEDAE